MFAGLLRIVCTLDGLIVVEKYGKVLGRDRYSEEEIIACNYSERRKSEFFGGRSVARIALDAMGRQPCAIGKGGAGEPIWPDSVAGSITHTKLYTAVVVSHRHEAIAGIDAEMASSVDRELWPIFCTEMEIEYLSRLPNSSQQLMGATVFCVKEAYYKCQYQITRKWKDFQDVEVHLGSSIAKIIDHENETESYSIYTSQAPEHDLVGAIVVAKPPYKI